MTTPRLAVQNGTNNQSGFMAILRLAIYSWMAASYLQSLTLVVLQLVIQHAIS
jgi:hypothetical protein